MKITVLSKDFKVSDKLKGILDKKIQRIEKYFDPNAKCVIVCSTVGQTEKMELTITSKRHSFRAQVQSRNMYANVDAVLAKIEKQVVKTKDKLKTAIRKEGVQEKLAFNKPARPSDLVEPEVRKNKSFDIKILTDEQAKLGLETLDHNFFVYASKTTGQVNIMYRRGDGHVGIIEIGNAFVK